MASETAGIPALTSALWRQRDALRLLAASLAGTGDPRAAVEELRLGEVLRSIEAEELARALGLPADSPLADIAAVAPEPWQTILVDHLVTLRRLYTEITGIAAVTDQRIWQQSLDDFLS